MKMNIMYFQKYVITNQIFSVLYEKDDHVIMTICEKKIKKNINDDSVASTTGL